jgi:hypothetical protein
LRLNDVYLRERLFSGCTRPHANDSGVIEVAPAPRQLLLAEHERTENLELYVEGPGETIREPEPRRNNAHDLVIPAVEQD